MAATKKRSMKKKAVKRGTSAKKKTVKRGRRTSI